MEENKEAGKEDVQDSRPDATTRDVLDTPMSKDEARKALAEIDVQVAQLGVLRYQALDQLNQIDAQIAQANFERTVVLRRTLNVPEAE